MSPALVAQYTACQRHRGRQIHFYRRRDAVLGLGSENTLKFEAGVVDENVDFSMMSIRQVYQSFAILGQVRACRCACRDADAEAATVHRGSSGQPWNS